MKKGNIEYLDGLKGIAILSVTLVHVGASELPGLLGLIAASGGRGAQLFLVISSLLIFKSLSHTFPNRNIEYRQLIIWYVNKILRLVPLYYLAIAICLYTSSWTSGWLGNEDHITFFNVLSHVLFLHAFFPHYINSILDVEWYIGTLSIFYLVAPYIYIRLQHKKSCCVFAFTLFSKSFI